MFENQPRKERFLFGKVAIFQQQGNFAVLTEYGELYLSFKWTKGPTNLTS